MEMEMEQQLTQASRCVRSLSLPALLLLSLLLLPPGSHSAIALLNSSCHPGKGAIPTAVVAERKALVRKTRTRKKGQHTANSTASTRRPTLLLLIACICSLPRGSWPIAGPSTPCAALHERVGGYLRSLHPLSAPSTPTPHHPLALCPPFNFPCHSRVPLPSLFLFFAPLRLDRSSLSHGPSFLVKHVSINCNIRPFRPLPHAVCCVVSAHSVRSTLPFPDSAFHGLLFLSHSRTSDTAGRSFADHDLTLTFLKGSPAAVGGPLV